MIELNSFKVAEKLYCGLTYNYKPYIEYVKRVIFFINLSFDSDEDLYELLNITCLKDYYLSGVSPDEIRDVLNNVEWKAVNALEMKPEQSEEDWLDNISNNSLAFKVMVASLRAEAECHISNGDFKSAFDSYGTLYNLYVKGIRKGIEV